MSISPLIFRENGLSLQMCHFSSDNPPSPPHPPPPPRHPSLASRWHWCKCSTEVGARLRQGKNPTHVSESRPFIYSREKQKTTTTTTATKPHHPVFFYWKYLFSKCNFCAKSISLVAHFLSWLMFSSVSLQWISGVVTQETTLGSVKGHILSPL